MKLAYIIPSLVIFIFLQSMTSAYSPYRLPWLTEKAKDMGNELRDQYFDSVTMNELACAEKKCSSNHECCYGFSCIAFGNDISANGKCKRFSREGEKCTFDHDCESSLVCTNSFGFSKTCKSTSSNPKKLGEFCSTSSDCNQSENQCCRIIRRLKKKPRKMCYFYTDPNKCIGEPRANFINQNLFSNSLIARPFQTRMG